MTARIRILIADDHAIVREGLRTVLADEPEFEVVGEAASGADAVQLAINLLPDVVLMDIVMPGLDGIEATRKIKELTRETQVVVLTSFSDSVKVKEAIQAGAIGYLMKDVLKPDLIRAIRAAAEDRPTLHPEAQRHLMDQVLKRPNPSRFETLTRREGQVLGLIAEGCSNKEIALHLELTEGTVKGYVSSLLVKIGALDRTQAALLAVKHQFPKA